MSVNVRGYFRHVGIVECDDIIIGSVELAVRDVIQSDPASDVRR